MSLPTSTPSEQGVDAAGIGAFLDAAAAADLELHSFAIARHGQVVAEGWWDPYGPERVHLLYSLSKSFTATTVATLIAEGAVALDDPVLDHLPTDGIDVDPRWASVLVKHCLSMTVGHTVDAIGAAWLRVLQGDSASFLAAVLHDGPDAEPGTVFCYNQVATYVLSRLVAHVTGRNLLDVARERVLDPLGFGEVLWHRDPDGFELGFSGAHARTRDLLSLVQLWLDRGNTREGAQLVPEWWYDQATVPFLAVPPDDASDWAQGYGFSYWIARHGYRGDGAYGQYGIVLAEHDVAIAITSEVQDMQAVLDLVWTHLLPAFAGPGSAAADAALASRLSAAAIPALGGDGSGVDTRTLTLPLTESDLPPVYSSLTVAPGEGGHLLTFAVGDERATIPVGAGVWVDGAFVAGGAMLPTAASGGWDGNSFTARVRFVETPHSLRVQLVPAAGVAVARWILPPLSGPDPAMLAARRSVVE